MIDIAKKYRTRDGRDVRVLCTDAGGQCPVVATVPTSYGIVVFTFTPDGYYFDAATPTPEDLIEVKAGHSGWLNVYVPSMLHASREDAAKSYAHTSVRAVACIYVAFREGDGLDGE